MMIGRWLLIIALLLLLYQSGTWLTETLDQQMKALLGPWGAYAIALWTVIYILMLALPFVPGLEISFAMMMLLGLKGIVIVYFGTLIALSLSYWAGHAVPLTSVACFLRGIYLTKAAGFVDLLATKSRDEQLTFMMARLPSRWAPWLFRQRYLAIAVLFNLPGNVLLGGGGGIAFIAGLSRHFHYLCYLGTISLAILPVPIYCIVTGRY